LKKLKILSVPDKKTPKNKTFLLCRPAEKEDKKNSLRTAGNLLVSGTRVKILPRRNPAGAKLSWYLNKTPPRP
jgi:hypothetical protein